MIDRTVLIAGPLTPFAAEAVSAMFRTLQLPAGSKAEPFLCAHAAEVEGMVLAQVVDEDFLDRFPRLRIIANFGVGYDNLPTLHAASRGILVTHTPHVLTEDVADTAWALILMAVRRFGEAERYLRAGCWARDGMFPLSASLQGRRLSILGMGRIGQAIARRAPGFGVPVAYHDVASLAALPYTRHESAKALAASVDILVAALPGSPSTRRLVDAEVLEALGSEGFFVNVGRGTVVDQPALIRALKAGRIAGAGLDVYESEPHLPQELLELDRIVLLPHVASGSRQTREAMTQLVIDNLAAFFTTGRALTPVPDTPNPA
jgi:lactate dehydrogenase-like 2-hydroxyacid dehydrogenase